MKTKRRINCIAAVAIVGASWFFHAAQVRAQYVVSDPLNTVQATITAGSHVMSYAEQVTQYAKQVQQYETQLQQYQTQIQNLQNLGQFKWADANTSLNQLVGTVNGTTGAYNTFLSQFQTQAQCNQHPPTIATFRQSTAGASATELPRTARPCRTFPPNANMAHDAAVLSKMTASAQGHDWPTTGVASGDAACRAQVHQLQELRALLVHLADATTARNASLANKEAAEGSGNPAGNARESRFVHCSFSQYINAAMRFPSLLNT